MHLLRDVYKRQAGEVSKDLTRRLLLPEDIVEADKQGIIHFHDSDYFAQHMPVSYTHLDVYKRQRYRCGVPDRRDPQAVRPSADVPGAGGILRTSEEKDQGTERGEHLSHLSLIHIFVIT